MPDSELPLMLIEGKLVPASDGGTFSNVNPATEEIIGFVPDATDDDVRAAIRAARSAFDETTWSTDHGFRAECLLQLQAALESEQEEFRSELVAEVGAPLALTYGPQLDSPLQDALRWPAAQIETFAWERDLGIGESFGMTSRRLVRKEGVGVVAAITPWNFPFEVEINKLGQALAAGNSVVLKPAPDTPAHALRMARLIADKTDIPNGIVNIVTPNESSRAQHLLTDERVDLVSFTGSTAVGRRVMELGAATFKRTFLELGGKSALVVLEDADFAATLPMAAFVLAHAGQGCAMLTRLLLPRSRYEEGVEIVAEAFGTIGVGDPNDLGNLCGPVINKRQQDKIIGYVERAKADGARVAFGGNGRPAGLEKGFYVEPTLFADVTNDMEIARDEIFGPVLVVIPFDDDDDAVRIANDSMYGLGGGVSSGSDERALSVARRMRTGVIGVNGGSFYGVDVPFGGFKSSGIGRQNGLEGFEQYTETKALGLPPHTGENQEAS